MAGGQCEPITVSRRIGAPAREIFRVLADPRRHLDLDGSGMLREVVSGTVISGAGDIFVMKMYFSELGVPALSQPRSECDPCCHSDTDCSRTRCGRDGQRIELDAGVRWARGADSMKPGVHGV